MGRPKKYNNAEEMQKKIDEYFNGCQKPVKIFNKYLGKYITVTDEKGNIEYEQYKPYTITGLANALNMSRQDLINYEKDNEFFDTITCAKRKVEQYVEERLFDRDGAYGAKFNLANNFSRWKDKQEVEVAQEKPFELNIKVIE